MKKLKIEIITPIPDDFIPKRNDEWKILRKENQAIFVSKLEEFFPLVLNLMSFEIYSLCDGRRTVKDIVKELSKEYLANTKKEIEEEVKKCIARLKFLGLIE